MRAGVQSSAAALVPLLVDRWQPASVVDVGCGEGWFVKEFTDRGIRAEGVDGHVDGIQRVDLAAPPYPDLGTFDLAISLEVAEHIDPANAGDLVAWLCRLAPVVVFSAALPGQGGPGHVNEQWPAYWGALFAEHGFGGSEDLRGELWADERIEWWYRQNLLVFTDGAPVVELRSLVHPGAWAWHGHA